MGPQSAYASQATTPTNATVQMPSQHGQPTESQLKLQAFWQSQMEQIRNMTKVNGKKKRVPRPHIQKSTPTHCVGRLQIPRTPSGANQKDYETRRRSQSKREKNYLINLINIYLDDKR